MNTRLSLVRVLSVALLAVGISPLHADPLPDRKVVTTLSEPDTYGRVVTTTRIAEAFPGDAAQVERYEQVKTVITNDFADVDLAVNWLGREQLVCRREKFEQPNEAIVVRRTAYRYDAASRLIRETLAPSLADCATHAAPVGRLAKTWTYYPAGNVHQEKIVQAASVVGISEATPRIVSTVAYEPTAAYPNSIKNALNHETVPVYDTATGELVSREDPNDLLDSWQYDEFSRPHIEIDAEGRRTTRTYTWCDGSNDCPTLAVYRLETVVTRESTSDKLAPTEKTYFDSLDRLIQRRTESDTGAWIISEDISYNALGQVVQTARPYFQSGGTPYYTTYTYDGLGRVTSTLEPGNIATSVSYGVQSSTRTNAKSKTKVEYTGLLGKPRKIVDEAGSAITYTYDAEGRLRTTTDALGNQRYYEYDAWGNKLIDRDPDLGEWTYTYDGLGNIKSQTNKKSTEAPAGQTAFFTYDALNRLTARSEPDLNSYWEYDTANLGTLAGRKVLGGLARTWTDHDFDRTYVYDSKARVTSVTVDKAIDPRAQTSDPHYTFEYGYDEAGRAASVRYPSGVGYKQVYDAQGYLKEVRELVDNALLWRADIRDAEGRVRRETLGNNLVTDHAYKPTTGYIENVLTGTLSGGLPSGSVQSDTYVFDSLGNLQTRNHVFAGNNLFEIFTYDDLNRLKSVTSNNGLFTATKSAEYDAIGNITFRSDVGVYAYNPSGAGSVLPHAVASVAGLVTTEFDYDANGNMTAGNGRAVSWTSFDMPEKITQGSITEEFLYTSDHERVRRTSKESTVEKEVTVYLNPRIDQGGTYEKTYLPGGIVEQTNHIYAGGQVIGAIVLRADSGQPAIPWSTNLATAPTTANPNASGITLPASDPNGLIAWSNTAALDETTLGRLEVWRKDVASASNRVATGQRTYSSQSVTFRAEITTTTNVGGNDGRYIIFGVKNDGSTAAELKTARFHRLLLKGTTSYSSFVDGNTVNATTGALDTVNMNLQYAVEDNKTYVVEIETTPTLSTLYFYKKGESRALGVRHSLPMDWAHGGSSSASFVRSSNIIATPLASATGVNNVTYIDNLSETPYTTDRRYFHTDHLGSVIATTNAMGEVQERLSYDAWGKRRNVDGRDDLALTPLWTPNFTTDPTTSASNPTGLKMPTGDTLGIMAFDTALDRLVVSRRDASTTVIMNVQGTRKYQDDSAVLFRGRMTTSTTAGSGRYASMYVNNEGLSPDGTLRRFGVKFTGSNLHAIYLKDPAEGSKQQLLSSTLQDNAAYIVEIYTDKSHNVLYVYPESGTPADGWTYSVDNLVWEGGADKQRYLRIDGQAIAGAASSGNPVYVDLLSETQFAPQNELTAQSTRHGYTLHEHLDTVGLVHMNGRIYDPQLGRFMSADPNVFYPDNMQDFNVYGYVQNNPLSFTDPSGFETVREEVTAWWIEQMKLDHAMGVRIGSSGTYSGLNGWSEQSLVGNLISNSGRPLLPGISIEYGVNNTVSAPAATTSGSGTRMCIRDSCAPGGVNPGTASQAVTTVGAGSVANTEDWRQPPTLAERYREQLGEELLARWDRQDQRDNQLVLGIVGGSFVGFLPRFFGFRANAAEGVTRAIDDLGSLRGAKLSSVEKLADAKYLQRGWTKGPSKDGNGIRYTDGKGGVFILNKGYPNAKDPLHRGPYIKTTNGSETVRIPLEGNPAL